MKRISIKIVGQSGSGILSLGQILAAALVKSGKFIVAERDFPSLIKGGHSVYQIDYSDEKIYSLLKYSDYLLSLDKNSAAHYKDFLKKDAVVLSEQEAVDKIAENLKISPISKNIIHLGILCAHLNIDPQAVKDEIQNIFKNKKEVIEENIKGFDEGFAFATAPVTNTTGGENIKPVLRKQNSISGTLLNGNEAIALGAINAKLGAYFAYPMSPASTILTYLAKSEKKTGVIIKQAEDEITAVQMALGSMFMGMRAMTATSGGGFDLMTETISSAGMMEVPLVIVLAQRPGPATGLPTWTMQGDLNLAINAGHGEFSKIILAASDPESCFSLIERAFYLSEKFETPVILLTEKTICERQFSVNMPANFEPEKVARDIPGSSEKLIRKNSDEHNPEGDSEESSEIVAEMYKKRMEKSSVILKEIPDPVIYGRENADISFIGWGSTKNVVLDAIALLAEKGITANYLHYEYLWPLKTEKCTAFFENNKKVCLLEGNYNGQLGKIIEQETGKKFADKLLKYNGRGFYPEELIDFATK